MMRSIENCNGKLHPKAVEGIKLFNTGEFFEAHEELEAAWRDEAGEVRNLYRGILQVAVAYLHITRGNYEGAVKVYDRSLKWTQGWNDVIQSLVSNKTGEWLNAGKSSSPVSSALPVSSSGGMTVNMNNVKIDGLGSEQIIDILKGKGVSG